MAQPDRLQARKQRLRALGALYKPRQIFGRDVCTYCGDPAETIDHVPALDVVYSMGVDEVLGRGIALVTMPACRDCNGLLGSRQLLTVEERANFLHRRLQDEHARLKTARWTQEEMAELGRNLRAMVKNHALVERSLVRRMQWADALCVMVREGETA